MRIPFAPLKNNKNKQMKNLQKILYLFCISIIISCKKEDADDPNIEYASFNTNLTYIQNDYNYKSFDVNNDGINDISIYITSHIDGDIEDLEITTYGANSEGLLKVSYNEEVVEGNIEEIAKAYSNGEVINSVSSDFYDSESPYLDLLRTVESPFTEGHFHGSGDKFIGFRFKPTATSLGFYFAWLRVNISADLKTIKIIDGASQKIADTPIIAGAK